MAKRVDKNLQVEASFKQKVLAKLDSDKERINKNDPLLGAIDYIKRLRSWVMKIEERDKSKKGGLR